MRRFSPLAALLAPALLTAPALAQRTQPPHAWLFGTWTGGLFPAAPHLSAKACESQPVVVFQQDVVAHASLIAPGLTRRVIETANAAPDRVEFRFVPASNTPNSLLGQSEPGQSDAAGFGCESPDVLHVERKGRNEITFPGCKDFPNPLVRCPAR